MHGGRTSRSLDASLAIPARIRRLEASGALRPQTGQTGSPNRSGRFWPDSHARSSASALWLSRVTRWFSGEPPQTPRTWCSLRQSPLMTWLPRSPGSTFGFVAQPRNRPRLHLAVLATMRPVLYPAGHRVPRTKPTCLLHTGGLTSNDLSRLFFHLHQSRVKPQPAPAILSQESVHTTLSITHHTRKRPSTGPRTTHGPHTPKITRQSGVQWPKIPDFEVEWPKSNLAYSWMVENGLFPKKKIIFVVKRVCTLKLYNVSFHSRRWLSDYL
jgi:hypothetical protein